MHVFVEGRVQGVFFRDSARREALRLGVSGWIRNLPDGRVEAVYEGEPDVVQQMITWTWKGPDYAVVRHVEVTQEPPKGEQGFRIR